jgi:Predicted membrane protein
MSLNFYAGIFVKLIATVVLLVVYVKVSGKSQLAPMTTFDRIGNMVVGAIGGTTLLNTNVSALDSAVFLGIWIVILLLIRFLRARHEGFRNLIDGRRLQLVKDGRVLVEHFEKANITPGNMEILLHQDGLHGLYQVNNVWFEPNGQLTIDRKGTEKMSVILIENGSINSQGLKDLEKDEEWLLALLEKESGKTPEEVFCAEWVRDRLWVYPFPGKD